MATRKNLLRIVLVAGLAVLLSGCYAHGGGRYSAPYGGYGYGGSYAYGGGSHHAPYHGSGRHGYRYRGW